MTVTSGGTAGRLHPALLHHIVNTLGWCSLRPLQEQALEPLLDGHDALLLAPTAGGKTEAACFPLLSVMEERRWSGMSVLYVCPLKALLNNLLPRLESYAAWLGRRVELWHGDMSAQGRQRNLRDPPDILLTTPESLESMLASSKVEQAHLFVGLRAVVVDEVHAFAGDDRGWRLLAVLERLAGIVGRPLQRVGLPATVGNPEALLGWLQGSGHGSRPASVVAPPSAGGASVERGAGLCGLGEQRGDRHRLPAPRGEATGFLRLAATGRGDRRRLAGTRRSCPTRPCSSTSAAAPSWPSPRRATA